MLEPIFMEETRVPITFLVDGFALGSLDPGSIERDIKRGTKIEVPFWLARQLASKGAAKIHLPKAFASEKRIGNLKLDPASVSLGDSPFFYEISKDVLKLSPDESPELTKHIQATLHERFKIILDRSTHMRDTDVSEFTRKLTHSEKKLFEFGYHGSISYEKWKNGKTGKLRTSSFVTVRKRKIEEISHNRV